MSNVKRVELEGTNDYYEIKTCDECECIEEICTERNIESVKISRNAVRNICFGLGITFLTEKIVLDVAEYCVMNIDETDEQGFVISFNDMWDEVLDEIKEKHV